MKTEGISGAARGGGRRHVLWLASSGGAFALLALLILSGRPTGDLTSPPPLPLPEEAAIPPLSGPPVIAIQAGHWKAAELPDELAKLRRSTGASYGSLREVDINRGVAVSLARLVETEGWKAILLPATVPPGLRADAFVALHADWSDSPSKRGWKIAPPWRASPASRALARALADSFAAEKGLERDEGDVTIGMRGYFAFSYRRFEHAASPFTPAALLELGFITNAEEGRSLATEPDYWAGLVLRGLKAYLATEDRSRDRDFRPRVYDWVAPGSDSVFARQAPLASSGRLWPLAAGRAMMPVDESGDWFEVFVPGRRATGWVMKAELRPAPAPYRPFNFPSSGDR
jgi:hypothetical protein